MRIGSSIPLLPNSVSDRAVRTRLDPAETAADADAPELARRGEVTRIRSRAVSDRADSAQNLSDRNLSQRSRDALQSYLANGPTLTERLGVELAGIDVQA